MSPRQGVDAVDLRKAKAMQQPIEIGAFARAHLRAQQKMPVQKETARGAIVQKRAKHPVRLSPMPDLSNCDQPLPFGNAAESKTDGTGVPPN